MTRTDLNPSDSNTELPTRDQRISDLLDKQDCAELVHRFARAIDRCDEDLIGEVFHADATDDHGSYKGTAREFVPWVIEVLEDMHRTQHIIGNILIELEGDTAQGESYFIAHHTLPGENGEDNFMIAAGRYLDRFERRNGTWRIAHRGAVYDWSSIGPSTDIWDRASMADYSFGVRGKADPSYSHFGGLSGS